MLAKGVESIISDVRSYFVKRITHLEVFVFFRKVNGAKCDHIMNNDARNYRIY